MKMKIKLGDTVELNDFHYLIQGVSGTGKSTFLYLLILEISKELSKKADKSDNLEAYKSLNVIDSKQNLIYSLRHSFPFDGKENFAATPEQAEKILKNAVEEIQKRTKLFDNKSLPLDTDFRSLGLQPYWVIWDETIETLTRAKAEGSKLYKSLNDLTVRILTMGRALGVFMICTSIRADVGSFPGGGVTRSTMSKILLADVGKEPDEQGAIMLFNTFKGLPMPPENGKFWLYIQGEAGKVKLALTPTLGKNVDVRGLLEKYMHKQYYQ